MRIACGIPKATNNHSEYAILIAFLPQQWSHERIWKLRYTCIVSVVKFLCALSGVCVLVFISLLLSLLIGCCHFLKTIFQQSKLVNFRSSRTPQKCDLYTPIRVSPFGTWLCFCIQVTGWHYTDILSQRRGLG